MEHARRAMPILSSIPFMSPRNDVNRMVKLASSEWVLQHNIALDSGVGRKESLTPLKRCENSSPAANNAKSALGLARFLTCAIGQHVAPNLV